MVCVYGFPLGAATRLRHTTGYGSMVVCCSGTFAEAEKVWFPLVFTKQLTAVSTVPS